MSSDNGQRCQGEIVEWSDEKRCGFVRPRGYRKGDPLVFLSHAAFLRRGRWPKVGDTVVYRIVRLTDTPQNRRLRTPLRAERAAFLGDEPPLAARRTTEGLFCALGVAYWCGLAAASAVSGAPQWPVFGSIVASAVAFLAYAWDKLMALRGAWRVSEANLHLIAVLGGWPGCAIAQSALRHKTLKESFQSAFVAMVVLNVTVSALAYGAYIAMTKGA